jgi:hypothetical protein
MMIRMVVAILMGLGAIAQAQKHPDFSGIWTPVPPKTEPAASSGGSMALPPSDLTIKHSAAELSISRTAFDIVRTETHKLDGSESTNKSGAVTRLTRNRWDGPKLVIEGKMSQVTSAGYAAWTFKEVYSLDARGRLVIESESRGDDGTVIRNTREFTRR